MKELGMRPQAHIISPCGIGGYTAIDPVIDQVSCEVKSLLSIRKGEMSRIEIMKQLALAGRDNFRGLYLKPALETGLVEMTIPDKCDRRLQSYRLTSLQFLKN